MSDPVATAPDEIPAPNEDALFPRLAPDQIVSLAPYGEARTLAPNEKLFTEGEDESEFYLVLDGRLKVTKRVAGDEVLITVHEPGEFTGALALLTGEKSTATGYAVGATRVRRIDADTFRRMLVECPEVAGVVLSSMALRRPHEDVLIMQRENLAALGKLSAGLAHELSNPAAAAGRAVSSLRECLTTLQERTAEIACRLPHSERQWLEGFTATVSWRGPDHGRSALERSDREEEVGQMLEARGVPDAYELSSTLVESGWSLDALAEVAGHVGDALPVAVAWTAARIDCDSLLNEIEHSVARISELVGAIKSYSFQGQGASQEVDVVQGLEATRTMLAHKLRVKNITVVREYAPDLPRIPAYGGELNQVWTNLLDNAIDAAPDSGGEITLGARTENDEDLVVWITDNGSGIAPDVGPHVFEPFFTTKPMGEGTGLGLDTTYRIVTQRHGGDIRVVSRPGETRFEIRLPLHGRAKQG